MNCEKLRWQRKRMMACIWYGGKGGRNPKIAENQDAVSLVRRNRKEPNPK